MAQITETNAQYYQGSQAFRAPQVVQTTFDTDLVFGDSDPLSENYQLNNFKVYSSATGLPGTYIEVQGPGAITGVDNNIITFGAPPPAGTFIVVQLKKLDGGLYGQTEQEKAYGETVEENYGGYQYVKLNDINGQIDERISGLETKSDKGCDFVIQHLLPHHMDFYVNFKKNFLKLIRNSCTI
mgnify:CR=1 FL=1